MALAFGAACPAFGAINPASATTNWTGVLYGNNNFPDPSDDQQTGSRESDIIGNLGHASLFKAFDGFGTPSLTDGQIAFRLRLSEDKKPYGFSGVALIGIDGDANGSVDVFVGADMQGSPNAIRIWRAGSDLNVSPNTTSIENPAMFSYVPTNGVNYDWSPVSAANDPLASSYNLDGNGTDFFLSVILPFTDLVAAMETNGVAGFNERTPLILIAATSTEPNALNQDLNGVGKNYDGTLTWSQLGAASQLYAANGADPIPEPSAWALFACAATGVWFMRGRRRR